MTSGHWTRQTPAFIVESVVGAVQIIALELLLLELLLTVPITADRAPRTHDL